MPIYEYRCSKCGDFEVMQKISDKSLSTCPTCRRKVTKLISSTSFQLKGSGWYITDYARKGDADSRKSDAKTDKSDSTKSESAKSDSTGTDTAKSDSAKSGGDGSSDSSGSKKKGKKSTPKAAAA
jgi:putative FmdB family regulatory protein